MASNVVRDYDHFKQLLGIAFPQSKVQEIAEALRFSNEDISRLTKAEQPGVALVERMENKGTISPSDISELSKVLDKLLLDDLHSTVNAWFNQIKEERRNLLKAGINWVQKKYGEIRNRSPETYPSEKDFQEFTTALQDMITEEISQQITLELDRQQRETQKLNESTKARSRFVETLIAEHIVCNNNILPLLKILHGINKSDEAKKIQALFEGFDREGSECDSSGKFRGKVIYKFTSTTVGQQGHRSLLHYQRILDKNNKIRVCHVGRRSLIEEEVKVILVFGRSGSGKTTMINALVNHILEVKWEDTCRYKISVDEEEKKSRSQAYGQTKWISAYFLHGHNLVIVDTPGFQDDEGEDMDKFITDQVRMFFDNRYSQINYVNVVAFVMSANNCRISCSQRTLFKLMLTLFSKNIEKCICLLATFSEQDNSEIPVEVAANKVNVNFAGTFRFNNHALFMQKDLKSQARNETVNKMMELKWNLTNDELHHFLEYVMKSLPVSTDDTAQVLADRKSLDKILAGILQVIISAIIKLAELKRDKESAQENKDKIENSEIFQYSVVVETVEEITISPNMAMVCHHCHRTCDSPCSSTFKVFCSAMRYFAIFRGCGVCEHNCSLSKHERTPYEYRRRKETITKTNGILLEELNICDSKLSSIEEAIQEKVNETNNLLEGKIEQVRECVTRLDQMALMPDTKTTKEYIEDIITKERTGGEDGWEERVELLNTLVEREIQLEEASGD